MKVLLCWPHRKIQSIYDENGKQVAMPSDNVWHGFPVGIGYLGAFLDSHGIEVKCFDFVCHSWERVTETLGNEMPDILGISCLTSHRAAAKDIASYMKTINPDCKVVLGNYHASIMYEQILTHWDAVDYCVVGDGSYALLGLTRGEEPTSLAGLAYRSSHGICVNKPDAPNINDIPFIKYELWNWQDPEVTHYFDGENNLHKFNFHNLAVGRGCYSHCSFCGVTDMWKSYSFKRPERIVQELTYFHETYGPPKVFYKSCDEVLPVNSKAMLKLCDLLIASPIKFNWDCYMRGDLRSLHTAIQLKKAGLSHTSIGLESGSQKMLDRMKKGVTVESTYRTFQYCHAAGINTLAFFITGTPGESKETVEATKKAIRELCPGNMGVALLLLYPGTGIYRECVEKGFINDDYWLSDMYPPIYLHEQPVEQLLKWQQETFECWQNEVAAKRNLACWGPESPLLPEYEAEVQSFMKEQAGCHS